MAGITTPIDAGTDVAENIDGKAFNRSTLHDSTGADAMGAVAASPAANTLLGRLKAIADAILNATFFPETQAISAEALPLPTGAATAAKQDNVKASIDGMAQADNIFAITPNDSADLPTIPRAILALSDGNVAIRGTGATPVTVPVKAGQIVPIKARRIYATNTTATVAGLS